jgi:hypothetical protein
LAKDHELGPEQLAIFNEIAARGDDDMSAYNENIYKPYLSRYVNRGLNMNENKYRMPERIVPNYVSKDKIRQMIYNKYKKGDFYVKSEKDLEKLLKFLKTYSTTWKIFLVLLAR